MEDIIAVTGFFTCVLFAFVAFGPIGRAIAAKINRSSLPNPGAEVLGQLEGLEERLDGMQQQLAELAERQDFSERVLAQARERALLAGGGQPPAVPRPEDTP